MGSNGHWMTAKVSPEMKQMITATVAHSPGIEGLSVFARHGFRLALADAIERKLIVDLKIEQDVRDYLERSKLAIGEPMSNGKEDT